MVRENKWNFKWKLQVLHAWEQMHGSMFGSWDHSAEYSFVVSLEIVLNGQCQLNIAASSFQRLTYVTGFCVLFPYSLRVFFLRWDRWSSAGSTFGFASSTQGRELCSDVNQPRGTGHARVNRPVIVHFKTQRNLWSLLASVASEFWRWIVEASGRHMLPFRSLDLDKEPKSYGFPKVSASLPKKQLRTEQFLPLS